MDRQAVTVTMERARKGKTLVVKFSGEADFGPLWDDVNTYVVRGEISVLTADDSERMYTFHVDKKPSAADFALDFAEDIVSIEIS